VLVSADFSLELLSSLIDLFFSGPEGKAAWILRVEVFQYLLDIISAAKTIQRRIRTYLQHSHWKLFLSERLLAIDRIQRDGRRYLAYKQAKYLRTQRDSPWEQLWDSQHNVLYYYNIETGESQYDEPMIIIHSENGSGNQDEYTEFNSRPIVVFAAPFRPLVRDYVSAALMQAWPYLEETDPRRLALRRAIPQMSSKLLETVPIQLLCILCETRRCVRFCLDCDFEQLSEQKHRRTTASRVYDVPNSGNPYSAVPRARKGHSPTPYCLTCFSKVHPDDNDEYREHRFQIAGAGISGARSITANDDVEGSTQHDHEGFLCCSQCNALATRKCLGPFSDVAIDELLVKLRRTVIANWLKVLKEEKVAGERKLMLLIEGVLREGGVSFAPIEPNVVDDKERDQEREKERNMAMEYSLSTSGNVSLSVLLQSVRSVLEKCRAECDECYCTSCYQSMHSGGRRALHYWKGFAPGCQVCAVCHSSPAQWKCSDCDGAEYCDACFAVFHNMGRKKRHNRQILMELSIAQNQKHDGNDEESSQTTASSALLYCDFCHRRLGHFCVQCSGGEEERTQTSADVEEGANVVCCDECFEFTHKAQCKMSPMTLQQQQQGNRKDRLEDVGIEVIPDTNVYAITKKKKDYSIETNKPRAIDDCLCVVCKELADKQCVECGDLYCSKVWMGNPGCFEQFHSKGNRATHTTEPFRPKRLVSSPALSSRSSLLAQTNTSLPSTHLLKTNKLMSASLDSKQLNKGLLRPIKQ
jgi:hypothetical protein